MAEGNFFTRLFGLDNANSDVGHESRAENIAETDITESTGTTLQDAVNFVAELQSYYYNDICKMQSDLVVQTLTASEERFINKKIKQDQVALSQIDEILDLVKQNEKEYQSIWRKSVYSFYDEIEKSKLAVVQTKVFTILTRLCAINTKQELKTIILNRIDKYKEAWCISEEIKIPENFNVILVDGSDDTESYQFGKFYKTVNANDSDIVLSSKQLDKIRLLDFEFEEEISTDKVWVYVSNVTRFQLNFMRRTGIIGNTWEKDSEDYLKFDIVETKDLVQYLKGILQIVFTKNAYAVISIVVPTNDMRRAVGPIEDNGEKVVICKKYRFYLKERSGLYKNSLLTVRVGRKNIPEKLQFLSYLKFKSIYF